ncbi:MAG: TraI domain-containing protein, partial [Prevotella sp.]|nr:TraI domain-containing protein [Prevotella sp.]
MEDKKAKFIELLRSTKRENIEHIIKVLEDLGFFTAPASTRFHLSHEGGLLEHSLNVCVMALELRELMIRKK